MATVHHPNTRFCAYRKVDGKLCGSPAWQDFDHCWHHQGLKSRFESQKFVLPALDDANAVQVATMDVLNALITGRIPRADAYALFYGLYLAKSNLKATTLVPPAPNDLAEMLAQAREEGRAAAKVEFEKSHAEEEESLAALLLRELSETPQSDDREKTEEQISEEWRNERKKTG